MVYDLPMTKNDKSHHADLNGVVTVQPPTRQERWDMYMSECTALCECDDCVYSREISFRVYAITEYYAMLDENDLHDGGKFEIVKDLVLDIEPRHSC